MQYIRSIATSNEIMQNVNRITPKNKSIYNKISIEYYSLYKLLQLTKTHNLLKYITGKRREILLTNS